jgi:hypothetical protein
MIEIVGYRSPEADILMDQIQTAAITFMEQNPGSAMLHWGLENDQLTADDLLNTPLNNPISTGASLTNLQAFQAVRQYIRHGLVPSPNGHDPIFDNNFTNRLGL